LRPVLSDGLPFSTILQWLVFSTHQRRYTSFSLGLPYNVKHQNWKDFPAYMALIISEGEKQVNSLSE
jgi:hypothetical protein